jgi:hypothetical protein
MSQRNVFVQSIDASHFVPPPPPPPPLLSVEGGSNKGGSRGSMDVDGEVLSPGSHPPPTFSSFALAAPQPSSYENFSSYTVVAASVFQSPNMTDSVRRSNFVRCI